MKKFFEGFEKRAAAISSAIKKGMGGGMQIGQKLQKSVSPIKVPKVGRTTRGISSHLI